jgi:transcriptional regulator with PAS, ATPase and Fis domain
LFESELFGYKKGAFTDAQNDKAGYISEAQGGTLFFDEISEVPLSTQSKLLRFIETKNYKILGESAERLADVRILAATNKNLQEAIKKQEFREDLYYRLQVLQIVIPPLRERISDIKDLVFEFKHFLKGKRIENDFFEALNDYEWPGNVRELISVLKRIGIHADDSLPISSHVVKEFIHYNALNGLNTKKADRSQNIIKNIEHGESFWDAASTPFRNRDISRDELKSIINHFLIKCGGKYSRVLKRLNIPDSDYKKFINFIRVHKIMK